mgnify:CR=1 FL=1
MGNAGGYGHAQVAVGIANQGAVLHGNAHRAAESMHRLGIRFARLVFGAPADR